MQRPAEIREIIRWVQISAAVYMICRHYAPNSSNLAP